MIWSILCIIFQNEEHCVLPVTRVRDSFDEAAQREIVVGHVCLRSGPPGTSARSVVSRKMHCLQCRQVTQSYKLLKLFQPYVSANLVADSQIVGRILVTGVAIESGFAS